MQKLVMFDLPVSPQYISEEDNVRNEIETKRNETKRNEINEMKTK
jgi:hypothetical protein